MELLGGLRSLWVNLQTFEFGRHTEVGFRTIVCSVSGCASIRIINYIVVRGVLLHSVEALEGGTRLELFILFGSWVMDKTLLDQVWIITWRTSCIHTVRA